MPTVVHYSMPLGDLERHVAPPSVQDTAGTGLILHSTLGDSVTNWAGAHGFY